VGIARFQKGRPVGGDRRRVRKCEEGLGNRKYTGAPVLLRGRTTFNAEDELPVSGGQLKKRSSGVLDAGGGEGNCLTMGKEGMSGYAEKSWAFNGASKRRISSETI